MSKPVAYRFKSPLSEEGQWEYGKEPPVGSRWEIEGLYRVQVNVPRTPLEKAAKDVLQLVDYMLRNGEWYQAQERADALRAALAQPDQRKALAQQEQEPVALFTKYGPPTMRDRDFWSAGYAAGAARAIEAALRSKNHE